MYGNRTKKTAFSIVSIALGVALSPFHFVAGPTKALPWQHMINAIAGIFLGPWYAVFIAFVIALIRNMIGTGTIFAFPGGMFGGLMVGLIYRYVKRSDYAALTEPIGTSIGAFLSALIIIPFILPTLGIPYKPLTPLFDITATWALLEIYWLISCIPGSFLGFVIVRVLRRTRFAEIISIQEVPKKENSNSR